MKNSVRLAVALVAVAGFSTTASAAATTSAAAKAEILKTISITKDTDLSFGQIAVNGAGTVYIDATNSLNDACTGAIICTGAPARGAFTIKGTGGATVTASVVESTINLTSGANSMTLTSFNSGFSGTAVLDAVNGATFQVGGTLAVSATQAVGQYSGTFNVTAEYQ